MRERSVGVDMIKVVAIVLIVIVHGNSVLRLGSIDQLSGYLVNIGVGLFALASGYLLFSQYQRFSDVIDIKRFYGKKLFRLFPLYWLALIAAIVMTPQVFSSPTAALLGFFGLQMVPGSGFDIGVFWFVGMILVFYFIYPVLVVKGPSLGSIGMMAGLIFIPFLIGAYVAGLVDYRFFLYFPSFVAGILLANIAGKGALDRRHMLPLSLVGFIGLAAILPKLGYGVWFGMASPVKFCIIVSLMTAMIACLAIAMIVLGKRYPLGSTRQHLATLSDSTYAIYLTHMTIILAVASILSGIGVGGIMFFAVMAMVTLSTMAIGWLVEKEWRRSMVFLRKGWMTIRRPTLSLARLFTSKIMIFK